MEIIAELEPSRRGVYCGSIGYWSVTGELDTSIAIRTAVVQDNRVYFSAGGGIVADSEEDRPPVGRCVHGEVDRSKIPGYGDGFTRDEVEVLQACLGADALEIVDPALDDVETRGVDAVGDFDSVPAGDWNSPQLAWAVRVQARGVIEVHAVW
jgi:hypothetical protein